MAEERIYIFKLPMEKIIRHGNRIENYTDEDAIMNGELVPISSSQLTGKIYDYYTENRLDGMKIRDAIVNIVVPSASGKQVNIVAKTYSKFAHFGFDINGRHYVRLCTGSGQLRNNTITYVWDAMAEYLTEALYCGITPEDLGTSFSVSKWNAYVGLSESGMQFLKVAPRVCVVSDYEVMKPHLPIDYIETERSCEKRKKKVSKTITRYYYDDPDMDFAPLNSFDGQGLADPAWMQQVALELGYLHDEGGYTPSEYILRAPWCKGLVVAFDFKTYCREYSVTTIKDIYGQSYNVDDIDVLLTMSQFKMWKVYEKYGGWQYHQTSMQKHNLKWGIVIANKEKDDDYRELNYQYIQALDLDNEDIGGLCKRTENLLIDLCSGHIETVYHTLVGFSDHSDDTPYDGRVGDIESVKPSSSFLQKVIAHNYDLLQDTHIQSLIYREVESKFNSAKIGKLLCRGGYSFIVSDPVAQIQHVIKSHAVDGDRDINVAGLIPAHTIYSNYWNQERPAVGKVVLMRSPLVDSSEVTVCGLVKTPEMEKWYANIKSGLILSMHDVNTLALQNCDFDGDRCFSSCEPILIKGAQKNPVPILYPSAGTQLKSAITSESMIEADIRGLNSAVGSLSNLATCLYALRARYSRGSIEYAELSRRIKIVSELVGVEIDKIKTGIPPLKPSDWNKERMPYEQYNSEENVKAAKIPVCSPEEQERIIRHNAMIPNGKPVFMRYIYETLNRDLIRYDNAFNSTNKYNHGVSLFDLLDSNYETLDDNEREIVDKYKRFFPAIDSPCNMNKICRRFECLHKQLKKCKGTKNMLPEFSTPQEFNDNTLKQMAEIVDLLQRQKRFITKTNNSSNANSSKQIAKDTKKRFDALHKHFRLQIMMLVDNDVKVAYNYLVELVRQRRCAESTVWAVLDELILCIIPSKPYRREVAA